MSRVAYSEEEDYPGQFFLWEANLRRSMHGRAGRQSLEELRDALLALPQKRLIQNKLAADGDVCTVGALLLFREAKKVGDFPTAQANLEAMDRVCVCNDRITAHDERGVCLSCVKSRAWSRIRDESSTSYNNRAYHPYDETQRLNPELVEEPEWHRMRSPWCEGWRERQPDPEVDWDDDQEEGDFTRALAKEAGMPSMVAWYFVAQNDEDFGGMSPEERYRRVLADVERELRVPVRA